MATKAGKLGAVFVSTGASVPLANEPCSNPSADLTNYQVTSAARRYLDRSSAFPVTIQVSTNGGTTWGAPASPFTIQYVGGWIRFPVAQAAATIVRLVTGSYWVLAQLANATEWQASLETDLIEVTVFGSAAKSFVPTVRKGSGTFKQFWPDATILTAYLATGTMAVVQLYVDTVAGTRFEAYAWIKTDSLKALEAGMIEDNVAFTIDGDFYEVP